jgi:hypothetical protein
MQKFDRFEFEQQLMTCWGLVDHLGSISEGVLDRDWTNDKVANALIGLKEIYNLEFEKLFSMFERGVNTSNITSQRDI